MVSAVSRVGLVLGVQRIGRYEVLNHLASGGMGQVYLARATGLGGFERQVVVKTLDLSITDDDESFVTMFLDEARLVGALHHQYIAPVYEVGCDDEGRYYLVMDYVHGETTEAVFRANAERSVPIPLPFALTVVSCVANALDYAHNLCAADGTPLDIVHRDISPSNVMVGYDGGVKLIDFGIAKAANRATKTQVGTLKGKIGYLAPEQILRKHVDHRADIFALGIVLYELTTATRAFRDASDLVTLERITGGDVRPPSQFVPGYPPDLEKIVLRALQTDPDRRFQDAGSMGREIEALAARMWLPLGHAAIIDVMTSTFGERRVRRRIARGSNDVTTDPSVTALDDEDEKTPVIELSLEESSAKRTSVVERAQRPTTPLPQRAKTPTPERAQRPTMPLVDHAKRASSQPGIAVRPGDSQPIARAPSPTDSQLRRPTTPTDARMLGRSPTATTDSLQIRPPTEDLPTPIRAGGLIERPTPPERSRISTPVPALLESTIETALGTPPPPLPDSERAPRSGLAPTTPPLPPFSERKTLPLQPPTNRPAQHTPSGPHELPVVGRTPTGPHQRTPTGPMQQIGRVPTDQQLRRVTPDAQDPVLGRVPTGPQMPRITFRSQTDAELADAPTHITGRRPERDDPTDVETQSSMSIPSTSRMPRMPTATAQIVKPTFASTVVHRMPALSSATRTWLWLCLLFAIAVLAAVVIALI